MNPIDVRAQVRLPPARILALCLKGIRHRLFRSLLTTTVVVLAVAFFMVLLADSVITRAVGAGVQAEVRAVRRPAVTLDLWFGRPSPAVLSRRLVDASITPETGAAVAGWPTGRITALVEACHREYRLTTWIEGLDAGTRAILLGVERADEALALLAEPDTWSQFTGALAGMHSLRPPMPLAEISSCARQAGATAAELDALAGDWLAAIDRIAEGMRILGAGTTQGEWLAWIATADLTQIEAFAGLLARHGFGELFPPGVIVALQKDLRLESRRDGFVVRLKTDECRAAWLKAFGSQTGVEEKLLLLDDDRAGTVLGSGVTTVERMEVAAAVRRERDLAAKEGRLAGRLGDDGALVSVRQGFLIAISLVVCMVGIANAMLMAITERFREIATMKCLGATDGFILTQFLMEAGIQGAAGGTVGTIIGLGFSLITGAWLYGLHLLWYFPVLHLLVAMLGCILVGLVLATLASIYPSWMASRMAPMEAMRVE